MKCVILAGGRGERLWPLSRKNYPKQFIQIRRNHSLFQETVARNMPYCDEFILVTDYDYRYIIESQMAAFQGVTYRCIYEEVGKGTGPAILLSCLDLQPSELIFVVPCDHLIQADQDYQEAVLQAKQLAYEGKIVLFGAPSDEPDKRYGWIKAEGNEVLRLIENPRLEEETDDPVLQNTGLLLFENGSLQRAMSDNPLYPTILAAHAKAKKEDASVLYHADAVEDLDRTSIERMLCESAKLSVVTAAFPWSDIGKLEDLSLTEYHGLGPVVSENSDSTIINECVDQAVVVNDADDLLVINTKDAVYIGKKGSSSKLKEIIKEHKELRPYSDQSRVFYRSWGYYEHLYEEATYRIRRVVIYSGKTIYAHSHNHRSENWTIVQGEATVTLDGVSKNVGVKDNVDIPIGVVHQVSNIGTEPAIFMETACGDIIHETDMVGKSTSDLTEHLLGIENDPFIKLTPAFKDYPWGGVKLRDIYRKKCDFDPIAESWELSAHPAGQSIVAGGRHKGMLFGQYLDTIGRDVLGWKCQSMTHFPLLIKFIDAKGDLSVQVHPGDDYALEMEHEYGKNEMWYVCDCEEGAALYVGFNRDVTREEVMERIQNDTILEILNRIPTHPGDVFFIPAGAVHAIGKGNLICEVQQSSDCTYRLYDYNRPDKYGNLRKLHVEKALDVLDYRKYEPQEFQREETDTGITLARCKYFVTTVYEMEAVGDEEPSLEIPLDDSRFTAIVCLSGEGTVSCEGREETLSAGETIFAAAANHVLTFRGRMKILTSRI